MARSGRAAALLLVALLPVLAASLKVTNLERQISVDHNLVTISDEFEVKNDGKSAETKFTYCGLKQTMDNAALIEAVSGTGEDLVEAKMVPAAVPAGTPEGGACMEVEFSSPLKGGASMTVKVIGQYVHLLSPFPEKVTQRDPQLVLLEDAIHPLLPYTIDKTQTKVTLTSSKVPEYTQAEPVSKSDKTLTYGPFTSLSAWALQPLRVHFENNQPFIEVVEMEREFEVSHWGNVYVEEKFTVKHGGAQLKGSWSRLDFQSNPATYGRAAIKQLQLTLPAGTRSMYYRDEIGNISTSAVRSSRQKVEVTLEPRFPLFGGWKTYALFGYSLPLQKAVSKNKDGSLRFHTKFGCPIKKAVVDKLVIKVVLPEGAQRIQAEVPFRGIQTSSETKHTYLDTSGRPVVVLTMHNVVPMHAAAAFYVNYRFSTMALLREPMLLIGAFAAMFATAIVISRMEFTMSKDAKWAAAREKEKVVDTVQRLESVMMSRRALLRELDLAAATKPVDECTALKGQAEAKVKQTGEQIKDLLGELEGVSGRTADRFKGLADKERELVAGAASLYSKKIELLKQGARAADIEKKVGAQERTVADLARDVKSAADKLFGEY